MTKATKYAQLSLNISLSRFLRKILLVSVEYNLMLKLMSWKEWEDLVYSAAAQIANSASGLPPVTD